MRRFVFHAPSHQWPQRESVESVTLDFEARHRRRTLLQLDDQSTALLDLERAVAMASGDGLRSEDGTWIEVRAAREPVTDITTSDPLLFLRVAWHLGNRHVPTEITAGHLRIRPDHVLEEMIESLGATVTHREGEFQPERGAYHGHAHAPDHASDHAPDDRHDHDHTHHTHDGQHDH